MLERTGSRSKEAISYQNRENNREQITLGDIIAFVRRFWITILVSVLVGLAGAYFYISTTSPQYVATARILIEPKIAPLLFSQQPADINLSLDTAQIESQIAVLESEKIANKVIADLKLENNPAFSRSLGLSFLQRIAQFFHLPVDYANSSDELRILEKDIPANSQAQLAPDQGPSSAGSLESIGARLSSIIFHKELDISRVGVSYAIEISYASLDPHLSASVANAIANAYIDERVQNLKSEAEAGSVWLESRLNELRGLMNDATQAVQEFRLRHDYEVAGQATSDTSGTNQNGSPDNAKNHQISLEELEVTAETYKKMYESILQAYTNSVNQQSYAPPNVRIITAATAPLYPSYPRPKLVLAFGVLAGLLIGSGLAIARQSLDGSIRHPQQITDEAGLACLGILPLPRYQASKSASYDIVTNHPASAFSRSLGKIKTAIDFADRSRPIKFLGVFSMTPAGGGDLFAGNLASLYAESGMRTLLVNADTNQNRQKGMATNKTTIDTNSAQSSGAINHVISLEGLSFDIMSKNMISERWEISPRDLKSELDNLDFYDIVIFILSDTTAGTNTLGMCALLDEILIAVRQGTTQINEIKEVVSFLGSLKAPVLGAVITT